MFKIPLFSKFQRRIQLNIGRQMAWYDLEYLMSRWICPANFASNSNVSAISASCQLQHWLLKFTGEWLCTWPENYQNVNWLGYSINTKQKKYSSANVCRKTSSKYVETQVRMRCCRIVSQWGPVVRLLSLPRCAPWRTALPTSSVAIVVKYSRGIFLGKFLSVSSAGILCNALLLDDYYFIYDDAVAYRQAVVA